MCQLDVALAADEEEGQEGVALDGVELVVVQIWWFYLSQKLLPTDRSATARELFLFFFI